MACVPKLLGKEQGYVSFLTALHLRGLLSQIPKTIQVATTSHARTLDSSVAKFEFLQIKPELMKQGTQWSDSRLPYLIATVASALRERITPIGLTASFETLRTFLVTQKFDLLSLDSAPKEPPWQPRTTRSSGFILPILPFRRSPDLMSE